MNFDFSKFYLTLICLFLFSYFDLFSHVKLVVANFPKQDVEDVQNSKSTLFNSAQEVEVQSELSHNFKFEWQKIREKYANGVVQIIVQVSEFNWEEPFKAPLSYESYGSGFFIDKQGYIVTNYHVIEEASRQQDAIEIQLPFSKRRFRLKVGGINPDRDIALLKLDQPGFDLISSKLKEIPSLPLGDSDKIRSIIDIIDLGYPLGQEKLKVTKGIICGREFLSDEPFLGGDSYFQIDAAINPGNSGGPSFNNAGEVIGISTSYYSDAQNIGFIIPINDVKNVIDELRKTKLQYKPFLGAVFGNTSVDMLKFLNDPNDGGWFISKVFKKTLFAENDVREGDLLYEIDGYKVDMFGEIKVDWSDAKVSIFDLINRLPIGHELKLVLYRKGEKINKTFKLECAKPLPIRYIYPEFEKVDFEIVGGMVIMELALNHVEPLSKYNPYLINYLQRDNQYESRLIISHIIPNSQAQKSRTIEKGELLEEINGIKVRTISDFRKAVLESAKNGYLSVKTEEGDFVVLSVAKILSEEDLLAREYVYEKTDLIKELYRLYKSNKKN
ncbi:TPA: hypothetical protein DEO28_04590 [Candidatus Dependentiae bacterium]|nr:MAG: Protease Do [candidate division TM6 bacterium GW2011_GWE2_31_21]KKP53833.1 MAG: Protease Do [candidate division TM6 bacterium GW2011_GWF2_33_332]HBS47613.1 hypothetical protein [Candidatus Dependentiae bacterium]HBZ73762.1 hypothetical protein [Candidatus Dependentiae bacterium]